MKERGKRQNEWKYSYLSMRGEKENEKKMGWMNEKKIVERKEGIKGENANWKEKEKTERKIKRKEKDNEINEWKIYSYGVKNEKNIENRQRKDGN